MERAVILADGPVIHRHHLNLTAAAEQAPQAVDPWGLVDLSGTLEDVTRRVLAEAERRAVLQALRQSGGDAGRASEMLGVPYRLLLGKLRGLGAVQPS